MSPDTLATIDTLATVIGAIAIIGFLWNLHRDVANLRERMARLEGLLEGFTRRDPAPTTPAQ